MDFIINLAGSSLWYNCNNNNHYNSSSFPSLTCNSEKCPKNSPCSGCNGSSNGLDKFNPLAHFILSGKTNACTFKDIFLTSYMPMRCSLSGSTGSKSFIGEAVPVHGLPEGNEGFIGFARAQSALPALISSAYNLPLKFFVFTFFKQQRVLVTSTLVLLGNILKK